MADDDGYRSLGQTVSDSRSQIDKGKKDRSSSGLRGGLKAAGASISSSGQDMLDRSSSDRINPVAYRKGGKVRKSKRKAKPRS